MRILGVDPGICNTGFCAFVGGRPIDVGVNVVRKNAGEGSEESDVRRIMEQGRFLSGLIKRHRCEWLAIEKYTRLPHRNSAEPLAKMHGAIYMLVHEHGLNIFRLHPAVMKRLTLGRDDTDKDDVIGWASKAWSGCLGSTSPTLQQHAADAVMAAHRCSEDRGKKKC